MLRRSAIPTFVPREHRLGWIRSTGPESRGWAGLDFTLNQSYRCSPMAARGGIHIKVSFGPTPSPVLPHALSYAKAHALPVRDLGSGTFEATFELDRDERSYSELEHLLLMVHGWKTTRVEVGGSISRPIAVLFMLSCARGWLIDQGSCGARFPVPRGAPKCRVCPLYDASYAAEFWVARSMMIGIDKVDEVPDHVPDEWSGD